MYDGRPISVDMASLVELRVTHAEPGVKGDRVSGATKPVTLETGLVIQAPLFVDVGDVLRVDTRTAEYQTRVT
jgi:elongation factor P